VTVVWSSTNAAVPPSAGVTIEVSGGEEEGGAALRPARGARETRPIVAYLPFLMLSGDTGNFLHALPVVMTITLVLLPLIYTVFVRDLRIVRREHARAPIPPAGTDAPAWGRAAC
jgi:hypothetical protein